MVVNLRVPGWELPVITLRELLPSDLERLVSLPVTDYGFLSMRSKKVCAPVLAPNEACIRVATTCGYELEEILQPEVRKTSSPPQDYNWL
jgi:hypothetical protein